MDQNAILLFGILGGIVINKTYNFCKGFYNHLIESENARTELCVKNFANIDSRLDNIEKNIKEKTEEMIKKCETTVNEKLTGVLAVAFSKSTGDKGTYKTFLGLTEDNSEYLSEKVDIMNNEVAATYKKLLDDVANRNLQTEN